MGPGISFYLHTRLNSKNKDILKKRYDIDEFEKLTIVFNDLIYRQQIKFRELNINYIDQDIEDVLTRQIITEKFDFFQKLKLSVNIYVTNKKILDKHKITYYK